MKKLISSRLFNLGCALIAISQSGFAQFVISDPQIVADQNPWGNLRPRIALDQENLPIVIWTNPDSMAVFMSKKEGGNFGEPTRINPANSHVVTYDWAGPDVASYGSKAYILYQTNGTGLNGPIYIHKSFDNGNSWEDSIRVDSPAQNELPWLPALGIDMESGSPMVAYMKSINETGHEWFVSRNNVNDEFTEEASVSENAAGNACDCCPATLATQVYLEALVFRNNDSNLRDIHASWEYGNIEQSYNDVDLDTTDWNISACPASGPSAFWNGTKLITAYRTDYENHARIFVSSFDTETNELISKQPYPLSTSAQQNYPIIDGLGNVWGLVWEQITGGQRDVYFTYSTTGLDGLGIEIINLTENFSGIQLRPDLIYDGDKFHIVFTDNGADAVQYLTIDITTSIVKLPVQDFQINMAPNPVSDFLNVSLSDYRKGEKYLAVIRDSMGNLIKQLSFAPDGKLQIDVKEWAPGNYSLHLTNNHSEVSVKQFIVVH